MIEVVCRAHEKIFFSRSFYCQEIIYEKHALCRRADLEESEPALVL